MTLAEVCRLVKPAVVAIGRTEIDDSPVIIGTGFNADPSGIVITCRHVIEGLLLEKLPDLVVPPGKRFGRADVRGHRMFVMFHHVEGDEIAVEGVPVLCSVGPKNQDAAVIMLPREGTIYPSLEVGDSDHVLEGEAVATCGFPLRLALREDSISGTSSFQAGIISAVLAHPDLAPKHRISFQLDMVVNPGNSGGPVFRQESGEVVGIVQSQLLTEKVLTEKVPTGLSYAVPIPTGLAYAVPINVVKPFLQKIRQDPEGVTKALSRGELPEDLDLA